MNHHKNLGSPEIKIMTLHIVAVQGNSHLKQTHPVQSRYKLEPRPKSQQEKRKEKKRRKKTVTRNS